MNIYDLKQDRASVYDSMKEMMDKYDGKEMDALDKEAFSKMEAEFDSLTDRIEAMEKMEQRDKIVDKTMDTPIAQNLFAKALSGNAVDIANFRNAAPTLGTDAQAGYLTAPVEFVHELIKNLDDYLFMRQISHKTPNLGEGQSLGFPQVVTDATDATWTTEVAAAAEETTIAFGRREFKPNRLAKMIKISRTLMNHSSMAESVLRDAIVGKIGTAQESAYMTGDGSGKPLGIFVANANGIPTSRDVITGNATAITADSLIALQMSLKQQYQRNAAFVMHRDVAKLCRLLKDGNQRYYWEPSLAYGQPDTLLGKPVYMSEFAPNTIASGNYGIVYGDFDKYWICDCDVLTVQVLNELYAVTNQNGYLVNYAGDGAPVVAEAFARLKFATA